MTAVGWLHVAPAIDLFSRRVVGWSVTVTMTARLVIGALMIVIWRRGKPDALLQRSDRDRQNAREQFHRLTADNGSSAR